MESMPMLLRKDLWPAIAALANDDDEQALAQLEPIVRDCPDDAVALFWMAKVLSQLRCDDARAAELLERAIVNEPNRFEFWVLLSSCRLALDRSEAQLTAAERAYLLAPDAPTAVGAYASALAGSRQRRAAVALLRKYRANLSVHLAKCGGPASTAGLADAELYYWEVVMGSLRSDVDELIALQLAMMRTSAFPWMWRLRWMWRWLGR